jgi:pyruvate formate lyase activating enzyme
MEKSKQAAFYETLPDGRVLCTLCPHDCRISEGGRGACAVRYNSGNRLFTLVYDRVVSRTVDPVEKKPLFHFYPGSGAYSVATVGCSLRCAFCQNWEIAQWPKEHLPKRIEAGESGEPLEPICPSLAILQGSIPGELVTPQEIVEGALRAGCTSIAYTYTEPTVFYELAYETAVLARSNGLKNIFVTSGFINEAPLCQVAAVLDAVNIDLKFFREESYRRISRARLGPVLDAVRLYHELGVWVEVTTLVIPRVNDSEEELRAIAEFVHSVGPEVPWHVSQFHPAYKMWNVPPTPMRSLRRALEIGRAVGLRYVYEGNVPGEGGENTYCYNCRTLLIGRYGFHIRSNRIRDGRCPECGTKIDGVGMSGNEKRAVGHPA